MWLLHKDVFPWLINENRLNWGSVPCCSFRPLNSSVRSFRFDMLPYSRIPLVYNPCVCSRRFFTFIKSIMRKLLFLVSMLGAFQLQAQARYEDPVPQKTYCWWTETFENADYYSDNQSHLKVVKSGSEVCVLVQKPQLPAYFACGYEVIAVDTTEPYKVGLWRDGLVAFSLNTEKGIFAE